MLKTSSMLLVLLAMLAPSSSEARVIRFVVEQRRPLADGMSFGTGGRYERLDGTAYFEVDPKDPLNAVIVNLDRAPRNARGMVEFSSTVCRPQAGRPREGEPQGFLRHQQPRQSAGDQLLQLRPRR
jgi:hypothetical protein